MIKLEHIEVTFGSFKALKDINIDIHEGEFFTFLGPSGCGKTTTLRTITGFISPSAGTVSVRGKDITHTPIEKRNIGMVFQSYELFPHMTVLDNVLLAPTKVQKRPKAEVQQEAEALLDRVGLLAKKNSYPRELSGGQKQRVAIVRALCMHPEILLFDEVTAALDPEMVREVLDVMLDLAKQGKTMIIVTHEMQFARAIANRVIFLDGGKIVEEAAPAEFFERPKTERAQRFLRTFTFDAVK